MKKALLLVTSVACLFTLRSNAQLSQAYSARLQTVLDSMCSLYHIKGASAAVHVPGAGTWTGVHGLSYAGQPITTGMAFPLNSNTKTYIAALMLRLQEGASLQLSDTIGKWIQGQPNINGQVTIRQLLNHTSGLYSYTDNPAFSDSLEADLSRIWQPAEMLQFVEAPLFAPGASWSYCNTNYLLAGMIIGQVLGMPIEQALRTNLLTPNGLGNTWFYPQEIPAAVVPHFWFDDGAGGMVDGEDFGYTPEGFYSAASSAGALFSTAEDNVMFWHKLSSGQIINAPSLAEWRQTVALSASVGYGLGVFRYLNYNGHVVYEHGGTGAGAINENLVDSVTGVCISVLTNQDSASNSVLFTQVIKALHNVTLAPPTAVYAAAMGDGLMLYPNPAGYELHVSGGQALTGAGYTIADALGRTSASGRLGAGTTTIHTGNLPAGTYFLNVRDASGVKAGRAFSIQR
jgi:D-alanyl-D-alanine carboxypeptidase